ncbi:MAG: DUF3795 domain-containing protein [Desulfarculus sp.]|nr:DUF3795 domain-containing protein [Pseudomonadota bacterium]MBV1716829.1 DUF3795 domain-containing protein [Desulfarculus sp.]MBU4574775.1 DUF3795 domain-containing protein [Pseudomonadota bacterium]MBU4598886.1 DUF3795 domain-containing protein [Pseudomonadota bacterium]MBV1738332.1 DUF3795 domain-containing protein [Desulfarculus sp.]
MQYSEIIKRLAPCGLSCAKCFAFKDGELGHHAAELKKRLGNFGIYAERFSAFLPEMKDYPAFERLLDYMAGPSCAGCRQDQCLWPDCGVAKCWQAKGVDFCFQCDEFPCGKTNFDPHLEKRWIAMNRRMAEVGVEQFFEETKDKARYV